MHAFFGSPWTTVTTVMCEAIQGKGNWGKESNKPSDLVWGCAWRGGGRCFLGGTMSHLSSVSNEMCWFHVLYLVVSSWSLVGVARSECHVQAVGGGIWDLWTGDSLPWRTQSWFAVYNPFLSYEVYLHCFLLRDLILLSFLRPSPQSTLIGTGIGVECKIASRVGISCQNWYHWSLANKTLMPVLHSEPSLNEIVGLTDHATKWK